METAMLAPRPRILVADPFPLIRLGLRYILSQANVDYDLNEAADAAGLLQLVEAWNPALVLTAPDLAGEPGEITDLVVELRRQQPQIPIVILTDSEVLSEPTLIHLLRLGVNGFVSRAAGMEEICETVTMVRRLGRYYSNEIVRLLQHQLVRGPRAARGTCDFSARQVAVLELVAQDYSSKDIARCLCTSERTVEYHRSQMLQKAGVRTTLGLVLFAIRQGILSTEILTKAPVSQY